MNSIDCLFVTSSKTGLIQFSIYPYLGVGYLSTFLKKRDLTSRLFDADLNKNSIEALLNCINLLLLVIQLCQCRYLFFIK